MRASIAILSSAFCFAFASDACAFPDGAPWGAANPAIEQDCANCHFGTEPVLASPALVIQGLPKSPEPGETYELKITFDDPAIVVAGFQLFAQVSGGDAGTLTASGDDVEFIGASIRSTAPLKSAGTATWSVQWHAPAALREPIEFFIAASAANDDGSPFGDTIHFQSYRLTPFSTARE